MDVITARQARKRPNSRHPRRHRLDEEFQRTIKKKKSGALVKAELLLLTNPSHRLHSFYGLFDDDFGFGLGCFVWRCFCKAVAGGDCCVRRGGSLCVYKKFRSFSLKLKLDVQLIVASMLISAMVIFHYSVQVKLPVKCELNFHWSCRRRRRHHHFQYCCIDSSWG